jgi:hypothetical protein
MNRKKLFSRTATLIILSFILTFVANKFYWYYSIWYFYIFMHFLAGIWVALFLFYLVSFKKKYFRNVFLIILGVLMVGIFWEIFEFVVNETIAQNPFNLLDTISDIFCDLAGASLASIYFLKRIIIKTENNV